MFKKKDLSLRDICMICNRSSRWDGTCGVIDYESDNFRFILSLYDKYMAHKSFQVRDGIQSTIYHEKKLSDSVFLSDKRHTASKRSQERHKTHKFKNKTLLHQCFLHFHCCSVFLTISECNNLECSFYRSLMKKHNYAVYWLEQYLVYISIFIIYSYCILTGKIRREENDKKKSSTEDECIRRSNNLKGYFFAGGRHQTTVIGKIVSKYLQVCTDFKLLNNDQYFKGNVFEFKGYELLNATLDNISESNITYFLSKIPLDQLSIYLNMKELREMCDLHNISMPKNIGRKMMLTYFHNHHCIQCDLYASLFTEKEKIKRVRKKEKR